MKGMRRVNNKAADTLIFKAEPGEKSMVKQSHPRKGHCDVIFIAGFDDVVVADGAAGLGYITDSAFLGPLYIVPEREEGIRSE